MYRYECERIEKGEIDYPPPGMGKGYTFNDINASFLNSGYTFIGPIYDQDRANYSDLFSYVPSVLIAL